MNERAGFLSAIAREPDEDTVRLAFADYLQESGERHLEWMAVFIRACIRNGDDNAQGEYHRAIEHTNPHDGARAFGLPAGWDVTCYRKLHELRSQVFSNRPSALTVRGFVSHVTLSFADLLAHAGELFAANPIGRVTIRGARPWPVNSVTTAFLGSRAWFSWINGDHQRNRDGSGRESAELPDEIFQLLQGDQSGRFFGEYQRHLTEADAINALSAACIAYGRQQASKRKAAVAAV